MNRWVVSLLILLLPKSICAQVLYVCQSANRDTTIYVMGTIHYVKSDRFYFDRPLLNSLVGRSDVFFSEILDYTNGPSDSIALLRTLGTADPDSNLAFHFTRDEFKQLYQYYRHHYGVSKKAFYQAAASIPAFMHTKLVSGYYQGALKMDELLRTMATAHRKPIINLDNFRLRADAYRLLRERYPIQWLKTLPSRPDPKRQDTAIFHAYIEQDTALARKCREEGGTDEVYEEIVLAKRNNHWMQVLRTHLQKTNFIACGWAHVFHKEYSLLTLLRRWGYSVQNVPIRTRQ